MQQNPPADAVRRGNAELAARLPFDDERDLAAARRGFIATIDGPITDAAGAVVYDPGSYAFIEGEAPDTANPSLWRQSGLVAEHGLFEVVPGIFQVRGFDLSNVTFVEGDTGVVVIDPLISAETAVAALALYRAHRGDRPVTGVVFTHSHIDHFGGVYGILTQDEIDAGEIPVVAPEGFLEHAVAENVYAGTAMARRSGYMYGAALDRGPAGQIGAGLGQTTSTGTPGVVQPTVEIRETGETITIDGLEIEFQLTPNTEAPSEMHFYFPRYRAVCLAENATHTLHNLLTLRGAVVRDPHGWSRYLTEAIDVFAHRSDVLFASHHWPTWGSAEIREFLGIQRDLYGYLHDQTPRMLNQGLTGTEIAEVIELPPALERAWSARGYYGSVSHNVKAIAQRYLGWFDGNPARLWPHPPQAQAERYVRAIGGVDRVVELAQEAYDAGDYRWAATLLDHAVFAEEHHEGARALLADTFEQLAYGSENGTWRNFFLSGATELRDGPFGTPTVSSSPTILANVTIPQLFDGLAIRVNGPRAWDLELALDFSFEDLGTNYRVTLRNGVLVYRERAADAASADATVTTTKPGFTAVLAGVAGPETLSASGDPGAFASLLGVLDEPDPDFAIVTP